MLARRRAGIDRAAAWARSGEKFNLLLNRPSFLTMKVTSLRDYIRGRLKVLEKLVESRVSTRRTLRNDSRIRQMLSRVRVRYFDLLRCLHDRKHRSVIDVFERGLPIALRALPSRARARLSYREQPMAKRRTANDSQSGRRGPADPTILHNAYVMRRLRCAKWRVHIRPTLRRMCIARISYGNIVFARA